MANLLLGYELPVGGDELRLAFGDHGQTARISVARMAACRWPSALQAGFSSLFDDHCAPLIEALAEVSWFSHQVFWSNLGHYVEFVGAAAVIAAGWVSRCSLIPPPRRFLMGVVIRFISRGVIGAGR